jgi:hypothetical protein
MEIYFYYLHIPIYSLHKQLGTMLLVAVILWCKHTNIMAGFLHALSNN